MLVRDKAGRVRKVADGLRCRHCNNGRQCRAHGLCSMCSGNASIRALYPSTSKFWRRGVGLFGASSVPEPTRALPGTAAKVAVLEARAARGQNLWHPDDAEWLSAPCVILCESVPEDEAENY